MQNEETKVNNSSHQVLLKPDDILDQAVYEKVWLAIGDDKEVDVNRLIRQGRISDSEER